MEQMSCNKLQQLAVSIVSSTGAAHLEILFRQAFLSLGISDHGSHITFHQVSQNLLQQPETKEPV